MPEILDPSMLDAKYLVSNRDAIAALRDLVDREGIFGGPSCGAVLVAAAREAQHDDVRDDRRAPARRRLEVPQRRHVQPRLRRDGRRPRGRRQLVVSAARRGDRRIRREAIEPLDGAARPPPTGDADADDAAIVAILRDPTRRRLVAGPRSVDADVAELLDDPSSRSG